MVYTVAIDARAIEECQPLGEAGMSYVASLLNSLDQNCLLIECRKSEFSCESLIKAVDLLVESVNNEWLDFSTRNRLKATLKKMRFTNRIKSYRFEKSAELHEITTDMMVCSLANVVDQVIVTEDFARRGKSVTLPRFALSPFEWWRSKTCSEGISKTHKECHVAELLNSAFRTLLSWSDQVYLIDYSLGENWFVKNERNTNYESAIPHWCSFFRSLEREIQIVIRTMAPRQFELGGQECKNLVAEIEQDFMSRLDCSCIQVRVELSDKVHSRFLHSCGFFIDIDRGIDICYNNGMIRRTSFGFKYDKKLESELR
jgi:hypothetical protein